MQSTSISLWQWRNLKCTKAHFNVLTSYPAIFSSVQRKKIIHEGAARALELAYSIPVWCFPLACAAASVQCVEKCRDESVYYKFVRSSDDRPIVVQKSDRYQWLVTELQKCCWQNLCVTEQSNVCRSNYCCIEGWNKWSKPSYWSTFHFIAGTPSGWGFFN